MYYLLGQVNNKIQEIHVFQMLEVEVMQVRMLLKILVLSVLGRKMLMIQLGMLIYILKSSCGWLMAN